MADINTFNSLNGSTVDPFIASTTALLFTILQTIYVKNPFRDLVVFISPELLNQTNIDEDFIQALSRDYEDFPKMVIRSEEESQSFNLAHDLNEDSLVLMATTGLEDEILHVAAKALKRIRRLRTFIMVYPLNLAGYEEIVELNQWCWRKQFQKVVFLSQQNQVYELDPYPSIKLINHSFKSFKDIDFFPDKSSDLKGFVVKTPIINDVPRVFKTRPYEGDYPAKDSISGSSARLYITFLDHINATLYDISRYHPIDRLEYFLEMILKEELDLLIHSYSAMLPIITGQSYPMGINDWCIMVPVRNSPPKHLLIINIYPKLIWLLIAVFMLALTLTMWLSKIFKPNDFVQSFLQTFSAFCGVAYPVLLLQASQYFRVRYFLVLLFFIGFFLTNIYSSQLSTDLTADPLQKQIDSVEDCIQAKQKVVVMDFEYDLLNKSHPPSFMKLLKTVPKFELDALREQRNTSYGYSISTDRWVFYSKQQKFTRRPLFRLTKICMGPFHQIFPMQADSHLMESFSRFMLWTFQAGFITHWETEAFKEALRLKLVSFIDNPSSIYPLPLDFYRYILWIWLGGLVTATLAFGFEILHFRRKQNKQRF